MILWCFRVVAKRLKRLKGLERLALAAGKYLQIFAEIIMLLTSFTNLSLYVSLSLLC